MFNQTIIYMQKKYKTLFSIKDQTPSKNYIRDTTKLCSNMYIKKYPYIEISMFKNF